LVFRTLPGLLDEHVTGMRALDFGCGTGRSTRFLQHHGFQTIGVDISRQMVAIARQRDPVGDYRMIADGDFTDLPRGELDLVLSAFTFDNVPGQAHRVRILRGLGDLLGPMGILVNVVSTPEMYTHEWVTFSTQDYPENSAARGGEVVRIVTTQYSDSRPVEDILWSHEDYLEQYAEARLDVVRVERPLGSSDDAIAWKSETTIAPWAIYVLKAEGSAPID